MSGQAWRDAVVAYIRHEANPADKFGHQPRLYSLAKQIGEGLDYDDDVLFAAVWMHDLGVFLGHRPEDPEQLSTWNHVPYTIRRSRELLRTWGFPEEKLDGVAEAIEHHQPKDDPKTLEGILLRDADILEQLGAIGALRAVVKVGRDTRYPSFSSVVPVLKNAANFLVSRVRLTSAKDIAEARAEVLRSFIAAIEREAGDALY